MTLDCTCDRLREAEEKAARWDGIVRCGECDWCGRLRFHGRERLSCVLLKADVDPEFFCAVGVGSKRREDA